jgi:hypothetical protein
MRSVRKKSVGWPEQHTEEDAAALEPVGRWVGARFDEAGGRGNVRRERTRLSGIFPIFGGARLIWL